LGRRFVRRHIAFAVRAVRGSRRFLKDERADFCCVTPSGHVFEPSSSWLLRPAIGSATHRIGQPMLDSRRVISASSFRSDGVEISHGSEQNDSSPVSHAFREFDFRTFATCVQRSTLFQS
jgi:hypothetical protein